MDVLLKSLQQVLITRQVSGHVHLKVGVVDVNYQASGIWQEHSTDRLGVGRVLRDCLHRWIPYSKPSSDRAPEGERRVNPSVLSDKTAKALNDIAVKVIQLAVAFNQLGEVMVLIDLPKVLVGLPAFPSLFHVQ